MGGGALAVAMDRPGEQVQWAGCNTIVHPLIVNHVKCPSCDAMDVLNSSRVPI